MRLFSRLKDEQKPCPILDGYLFPAPLLKEMPENGHTSFTSLHFYWSAIALAITVYGKAKAKDFYSCTLLNLKSVNYFYGDMKGARK